MGPTLAHGKICYLEIPANDVPAAADFYTKLFNWEVRVRGNGSVAFDDATGQVSGTWVVGKAPAQGPLGLVVHIMVADMEKTLAAVVAHGGKVVRGVGDHLPEITAQIADPTGNVFGVYQDPSLHGKATGG